jgi:type I restriction enzyme S subunit
LDDKIALNRSINQTLEAIAQALFKSWFVDFDPVKAKITAIQESRDPLRAAMSTISGKADAELDALPPEQYAQLAATAALFPDGMEESELGEIPRGWICPGIETLANVKQGKYLGKDEMQDTASATFPFPVWGGNGILGYSQKFAYSSPVVLMTCRGSNCGLIKHTESAAWVSNNSFACIPKIGSTLFLLTYCKAELFDDCVSGSAQPQITYTSLKTKKLKFPVESNVCSQFSKLVDSAFPAILSLNKQTSELSALRDILLPKLLSGELSVEALSEPTGAA